MTLTAQYHCQPPFSVPNVHVLSVLGTENERGGWFSVPNVHVLSVLGTENGKGGRMRT